MNLGEKQRLFARLVPRLIDHAFDRGFEVTIAAVYRSPAECAALAANRPRGRAIVNSLHAIQLAIDLNLFRGGSYLTATTEHAPLGEFWEALHELCRWGGRFGDGNHYSIEHNGVC